MKKNSISIGQKFGRLTVVSFFGKNKYKSLLYDCICECGKSKVVRGGHIKIGATKSCGCLNIEIIRSSKRNETHGQSESSTYGSWKSMKSRCGMKSHVAYHRYGGRGICVCERWNKFENFLSDMGERPEGKTLERKNSNGNYYPENCVWATHKEQGRNRSSNHFISRNGESKTISEWAEITGIGKTTIRERLNRGWTESEALS